MQVKVFEGHDMNSALKQVKESLGSDALILSTRTVRKSKLGLLGKSSIEVTAAIDSPGAGLGPPVIGNPYVNYAVPRIPEITPRERLRKRKVAESPAAKGKRLKEQQIVLDVKAMRKEIGELKGLMKKQALAGLSTRSAGDSGGSPLVRMIEELTSRGAEPEVAEQIVRRELQRKSAEKRKVGVRDFLIRAIAGSVRCSGPFFGPTSKPRRIALLGPTGVGKTTTVAKLTADYLLNRGQSVALVTIDIYRIAAAEQLKVYGEIMNVPVDVAGSLREFREILQRHRDKDLVLIDTAGRSPRDRQGIKELQEFIGPGSGIENQLVLSAATRERENRKAIKRFSAVPLQSLILTKLDECEGLGSLLNIHLRHDKPLSYLTDGQRVPEDLLLAEPGRVGQLVLGKQKGK